MRPNQGTASSKSSDEPERQTVAYPKGEGELYKLYGNPLSYPTPQAYWLEHGAFCKLPDCFAQVRWLGKSGGFWCHKSLVGPLRSIFEEIERRGLAHEIRSFDGCYSHRFVRGSTTKLSMHAFGAAIDLNASTNELGASKGDMHPEVVAIFKVNGWTWGGDFKSRPDWMHFQAGDF